MVGMQVLGDSMGVRYKAAKILVNPSYEFTIITMADVALIQTVGEIQFSDYVQPVWVGDKVLNF